MSLNRNAGTFWFRAGALALGGRIESPPNEVIESQASCMLPPIGGFASQTARDFNYRNIVRFRSATSMVSGQRVQHEGRVSCDTLACVAIEDLNILDVVTADRVVARISSSHLRSNPDNHALPYGSHFENLRIGGVRIEPRVNRKLLNAKTLAEILKRDAGDPDEVRFVDANGALLQPKRKAAAKAAPAPAPLLGDTFLAPLFDLGDSLPAGCSRHGAHGIAIPGLGRVFFGEYLITRSSRRLIMLRVELGCPITGSLSICMSDGNGHWDP
jgi:hypothetical protein